MKEIFAIIKETRYYPRQWWIRHVDEKHAFIFILHLLRAGVKDVLFFLRFFYATLDCHFVPQRKFNYPIPDSKGHRGSRGAYFEEEKATEKVSETGCLYYPPRRNRPVMRTKKRINK